MNDQSQLRGSVPIGKRSSLKPGRQLIIETKLFSSSDQVVPVRVVIGRDKVSGTHMFPIWGLYSVENQTQQGK